MCTTNTLWNPMQPILQTEDSLVPCLVLTAQTRRARGLEHFFSLRCTSEFSLVHISQICSKWIHGISSDISIGILYFCLYNFLLALSLNLNKFMSALHFHGGLAGIRAWWIMSQPWKCFRIVLYVLSPRGGTWERGGREGTFVVSLF